MFRLVNHIEATKGSQGKHLKFPIAKQPKGPCMNEKTFNELFPEVHFLYAPMRYQILEIQLQTFQYWDNFVPTCSLGVKST